MERSRDFRHYAFSDSIQNGQPEKGGRRSVGDAMMTAGYNCMRAAAWLGAWDVIEIGSSDVVLCPVKSNEWPSE